MKFLTLAICLTALCAVGPVFAQVPATPEQQKQLDRAYADWLKNKFGGAQ